MNSMKLPHRANLLSMQMIYSRGSEDLQNGNLKPIVITNQTLQILITIHNLHIPVDFKQNTFSVTVSSKLSIIMVRMLMLIRMKLRIATKLVNSKTLRIMKKNNGLILKMDLLRSGSKQKQVSTLTNSTVDLILISKRGKLTLLLSKISGLLMNGMQIKGSLLQKLIGQEDLLLNLVHTFLLPA